MEIAQMFGKEIKMLPERKGNRMLADIFTDKTEALGWSPLFSIESHIKDFCLKNKK
jgi:UDP-glucose 4-epimerase